MYKKLSLKNSHDFRNGGLTDQQRILEELVDPMKNLSPSEKEHINNVIQRDAVIQQDLTEKIR